MPATVTSIESGAFLKTSLTSITIGESVTSIANHAFEMSPISSVIFAGDAPTTFPGTPFDRPFDVTVYVYSGSTGFTTPVWNVHPVRVISAAASNLSLTPSGTPLADGGLATTATVTVRDTANAVVALAGIPVRFTLPTGVAASGSTCTTDASGTCAVALGSTTPGTYPISATIGGDPAVLAQSLTFAAAPADPGETLPATGPQDVGTLLGLAGGLLALGIALALVRRRPRPAESGVSRARRAAR